MFFLSETVQVSHNIEMILVNNFKTEYD